MEIQNETGNPDFKIVITAYVGGKPTNVVYRDQTVILEANIQQFDITDDGDHTGRWILPGREEPEPVDLLSQRDPQTSRTSWQVGSTEADSCIIEFIVTGNGTPEGGLRGEKVLYIAPTPISRTVAGTPGGEPVRIDGTLSLERSSFSATPDSALWVAIKKGAQAIAFPAYKDTIDRLICSPREGNGQGNGLEDTLGKVASRRALPFNDTDAYRFLKVATEAFLLAHVGSELDSLGFSDADLESAERRLGTGVSFTNLDGYLEEAPSGVGGLTLPYLAIVLRNMGEIAHHSVLYENVERELSARAGTRSRRALADVRDELCAGITGAKINAPIFLELIWSYWQEEGMLIQTMNAISRRFQNVRAPGSNDPLAALELNPLRPLNNVLWGYVQDEQHRLSVARRAYEYDHHYGISLHGKAISDFRPADSRSRFIEAFHSLLAVTSDFYRQDDDTTVKPDGFQVMNAITEVHFILSEGAHNQFGDLPSTARQEMLIQQWLLSRPELADFLPSRAMVAYPEPWMHRVEAMKNLQGWTDASILHFNRLAAFGEQILLSIRYGAWSAVNDPSQASTWARFWRPEIQGYIHAYQAVTGVDLIHDTTDASLVRERMLQPSVHLRRRLDQQKRSAPAARMTATVSPMPSKSPARR